MNKKHLKELTRAEEDVMQILWKINSGFVKDILEHFDEPKPAYNTVSTVVRILEEKGFVDHRVFGNTHEYYPLIGKAEYSKFKISAITKGYFSGSFKELVSFMAEENDLSIRDMEEIKNIIKRNSGSHD